MKFLLFVAVLSFSIKSMAAIPSQYIDLLKYVQPAPDQGQTGTCLFMATTGAIELIANKKYNVTYPYSSGPFDLSELFAIHAPDISPEGKSFFEKPVYKFNKGSAVHHDAWPFDKSKSPWIAKNTSHMMKVEIPKVRTLKLFNFDDRYATYVLNAGHIQKIKEALWKYKSPILVNYNDRNFWHTVLIVGYDDEKRGSCYEINSSECSESQGSFYIRNSFGMTVEIRDYDWFKIKGNAAFVVMEN